MFRILAILSVLAFAARPTVDDPEKLLRSKDPLDRLAAVEALAESGHEKVERLLLDALDDDDWEVQEAAARALGTRGGEKAVKELAEASWKGPVARVRLAAARSAARLDADDAFDRVAKKTTGDEALAACAALVRIAPHAGTREVPRNVKRLVGDKDVRRRAAGARAMVVCSDADRLEVLEELFADEHLGVRAAAAEGAAIDPRADQVPILRAALEAPDVTRTLERRLVRALAASIGASEDPVALADEVASALAGASDARVALRAAWLLRARVTAEWCDDDCAFAAFDALSTHRDEGVRAVAASVLSTIGGDGARERARAFLADGAPRVRRQAVRELRELGLADDDASRDALIARLSDEPDAATREEVVVALALEGDDAVVPALTAALDDPEWGVAACAAVSLGLTRAADGIAPLQAMSGKDDWRLRGAAVVGLSKTLQKDALPAIIARLEDAEPTVVRTAHAYLETVAKKQIAVDDPAAWRDWFRENGDRLRLYDPKELEERRQRYGYVIDPAQVFQGLDVLVLESRGDHIQNLLGHLSIEHRMTRSGAVAESGLDASGVFVSNCTGEILGEDVERLAWFTRVGGYVFGSCWALSETIARVAPGPVRRAATNGDVLDDVLARPCNEDSVYLDGVFEEGVVPVYHLEGAHLIEVREPEHVEVLVDSPECAERWGNGDLACWFRLGHGVMLDSTNHFDLQGLELARDLKKPEERMAYAVDHMGIDYATIRATRKESWWKSNTKAAREVKDLSTLELVTNFVRLRRVEGR